jgi:putative transposase
LRTRKIRFYPNPTQKAFLRKCFDTSRFIYNRAVAVINARFEARKAEFAQKDSCVHCDAPKDSDSYTCAKHAQKKLPWKLEVNLASVRRDAMKSDCDLLPEEEWQKEVPYDTRQLIIKDAVTAYKSATTNKTHGNIESFRLGFKSRRSPRQVCWFRKNALTKDFRLCTTRLKNKSKLRFRKKARSELSQNERDFKILRDGDAFYLVLTISAEPAQQLVHPFEYVSMDPGVRTFQTCYSPSGIVVESDIGDQLQKLARRADLMQSLKQRRHFLRLNRKIRDVVTNLHYQTAALLTHSFAHILLPSFGTSKMKVGPLASKTKRHMDYLGFYQFKQRLIRKGAQRGCAVYIVGEEYTTKTCTRCGVLNAVGGKKTYSCASCGLSAPRDVCGARNILLKHLVL